MKSFADFISEATPRGKAIQRGKISKADAQKRQAREDRKRYMINKSLEKKL